VNDHDQNCNGNGNGNDNDKATATTTTRHDKITTRRPAQNGGQATNDTALG
jgi:hypothetical protein